eukprot:gene21626-27665_t
MVVENDALSMVVSKLLVVSCFAQLTVVESVATKRTVQMALLVDRINALVMVVEGSVSLLFGDGPAISSPILAARSSLADRGVLAQDQYQHRGVEIGGETVGLITYMRTDAVNLAQDALAELREAIIKRYGAKMGVGGFTIQGEKTQDWA